MQERLLEDFIFHKQTYQELVRGYGLDKRLLRRLLKQACCKPKLHHPRPIHLLVDATYFGQRKEGRSWCVIVARDAQTKENLAWSFEETETTYVYACLRERLEGLGYTILSVTADGFSGIRGAFHGIPYQMCQVHMERLVIEGTTQNPLTEAGQVLLAITKTLPKTHSHQFTERLTRFGQKYEGFLNEKTIHPFTTDWSYTHEGVRLAYRSLLRLRPYLFTYEHNKQIPKTTNSLEGHFRHIKKLLGIHAGLSKCNQQKILDIIIQASTTSPTKQQLDELF